MCILWLPLENIFRRTHFFFSLINFPFPLFAICIANFRHLQMSSLQLRMLFIRQSWTIRFKCSVDLNCQQFIFSSLIINQTLLLLLMIRAIFYIPLNSFSIKTVASASIGINAMNGEFILILVTDVTSMCHAGNIHNNWPVVAAASAPPSH